MAKVEVVVPLKAPSGRHRFGFITTVAFAGSTGKSFSIPPKDSSKAETFSNVTPSASQTVGDVEGTP
jgi:hypothetical protein